MRKLKNKVIVVLTLILLLVAVIGYSAPVVFAETTEYTDALEDLQKDSNFELSDYPDNSKNYSIEIIQIAESANGELFIYTYQPCQKTTRLIATEINMSLTDVMGGEVEEELSEKDRPKLYGLSLINSNGVFCKYKVNDFTISNKTVRYYNIASVYRDWINGIDKETGNDNIKNAVTFKVGKCYTVITGDGAVNYFCTEKEVITVTDKYVDFLRYTEGYWLWREACDSHYIAFSADWQIDFLYEAEVSYVSCSAVHFNSAWSDKYKYGDNQSNTVLLSEFDTGHTTVTGIGGKKHTWSRIQTVNEFKDSENLADDVKEQLKGKQWVLRFADTDFEHHIDMSGYSGYTDYYTKVSEVTILRLKFEKDGKVYNLGVVDNKQTGDDIPGNPQPGDPDGSQGFWEYIWNCIVKLFTGKASAWETFVAVTTIVIVVVVLVCVIKFIKWIFRSLFSKED